MGLIIFAELKCMRIVAQRPGGIKKDSLIRFL